MNNLNNVSPNGTGLSYVYTVLKAYSMDNPTSVLNDVDSVRWIASEIMSGLGVFEDSLVYKEAIIRKLTWFVIRMDVSDTINKMFPSRDPQWLEGVINTCMDKGSSDWYRVGVMKLGISKIVEDLGIR